MNQDPRIVGRRKNHPERSRLEARMGDFCYIIIVDGSKFQNKIEKLIK